MEPAQRGMEHRAGGWGTSLVGDGEAGIGKSRLALELGRRVRAEGHVVASARAYEAAGRVPWGPVDLLRSDALRSHIDTLDTVWRAELARLLPELLDASSHLDRQPGDPAQRHRLFDAVSRAILAGDRPRLLIIDDLQWCDAETIELIGFVVRSGQTAPVLIVGTVRWEEIPASSPRWTRRRLGPRPDHRATRPTRRSHHGDARCSATR